MSFEKKDVEAGTSVEPVLLPMDAAIQHKNTSFARGLKGRHIQLLSIGGVIGTGLFIGSGRAITNAGPLSCVLSYSIFCILIFFVSQGAGEMATFLPVQGSFVNWAGRWIEPAAGFATGWNYYYTTLAFAAADVSACIGLVHFWLPDTSAAIWVTLTLLIFGLLNFTPVRIYGATEFYFAIGKVVLIVGLILMTFILMLGGNPNHDRFGFRYWQDPGVMKEFLVSGNTGRFLGFWYTFKIAAFSIGGPEFVSMASAEAINPRVSIPKAIRRVFWRLSIFYVIGILCVGILVPFNDAILIDNIKTQTGVGASPWVRGMYLVGMGSILPNIMNAVVLTSALSCGNSFCYVAIRSLNGLANDGRAPKIFARTNKHGVPYVAAALTIAILCLSYMTVSSSTATVFGWFLDLSACGALANYCWMCIASIRFRKAVKAQAVKLPFYGVCMPWGVYIALAFLMLIIWTNGFDVFIKGHWNTQSFITSFFTIPLNAFLYILGKWLYRKEGGIRPVEELDLVSGVAEIDADEQYWIDEKASRPPPTRRERFLEWLF